jgi:PAS domain S-box-containing protein
VDLQTGEAEVSSEQLALYGLPRGSHLGFAKWIAQVHPEDRDRVLDEMRAAYEAGAPYASEFRIIRADTGEVRWIQARGRRTVGADERALSFIGVNLDVTAAKLAETELREYVARLQATFDGAPVGLCLVDSEMRYLQVNARLAEINGLPVEAHIGRTLREVIPDIADQVEAIYRRVLETGEPVEGVLCKGRTAARPHEEHEWLVNYHPVREPGGKAMGVSVAVLDVTGLRRAQAAAKAAELATARFLAAMNHEFRTPVSIVLGFAELLRRAAAERGLAPELAEHVTDIHAAGRHLLSLVEDATRYAVVAQAGHNPMWAPARARELVVAAVQAAGVELDEAAVAVTLPPSGDDGPEIVTHLPTLREGLAALLREIARGAPPGATAEVSWQALASGAALVEVRCAMLVLPADVLARLRNPLGGASLYSRGLEGMGIGLAIAEGAARMHQGRLTAVSAPGDGTCFSVELPPLPRG